jgi:hypothetical protein
MGLEVCRGPFQRTDGNRKIEQETSSALLFTGVNADPSQNGREEVIATVELKGQIIILFPDCRDILRSTGIDRTSIFTANMLFKPTLVRDADMETTGMDLYHGVSTLRALRR